MTGVLKLVRGPTDCEDTAFPVMLRYLNSLSGSLNDVLLQDFAAPEAEAPPAVTAQHTGGLSGTLVSSAWASV